MRVADPRTGNAALKAHLSFTLLIFLLSVICVAGWLAFWVSEWPPSVLQLAAAGVGSLAGLGYTIDSIKNWDVKTWQWRAEQQRNRNDPQRQYRMLIYAGISSIAIALVVNTFFPAEGGLAFIPLVGAFTSIALSWHTVECVRHLIHRLRRTTAETQETRPAGRVRSESGDSIQLGVRVYPLAEIHAIDLVIVPASKSLRMRLGALLVVVSMLLSGGFLLSLGTLAFGTSVIVVIASLLLFTSGTALMLRAKDKYGIQVRTASGGTLSFRTPHKAHAYDVARKAQQQMQRYRDQRGPYGSLPDR